MTTEHKDVFSPRMSMKITEHEDVSFTLCKGHNLFKCRNLWSLLILSTLSPASVVVKSIDCCSGIANDHSINIQHGHDFEDEVLSEIICLGGSGKEVLNEAFDDKGRDCFGRVNS